MNARKILLQTIERLAAEKPVEKISVQEILDEAEVSRKTFYKYFLDKYELANSVFENSVTPLLVDEYNGHNWKDVQKKILTYFLDHIDYYKKLWIDTNSGFFYAFFVEYTYQFFRSVYCYNHETESITKSQEYHIWYITAGNVIILDKWIHDGCEMPIDQLIEEIDLYTPREFYEYLK